MGTTNGLSVETNAYIVAGGTAGIVSRTVIAPIERVKILFQITKTTVAGGGGYMHLVQKILREEGFRAFWKGNTAAVTRVVPYMSLTFLSYEEYKNSIQRTGASKTTCSLLAGSLAGVTAVSITYPLDLVRAAMATPTSTHASMAGAMRTIVEQRGVGALYSGVSATLVGVAPYAGLKFASCACAELQPATPQPSHASHASQAHGALTD